MIPAQLHLSQLSSLGRHLPLELRFNTRVLAFERAGEGYWVQTEAAELQTRQLIVAAGPWTSDLISCPRDRPGLPAHAGQGLKLARHQTQGIVVGAGSGHMFKWAPLVARMVADMLSDDEPSHAEARALLPAWAL